APPPPPSGGASEWKDQSRPPVIPFPPAARWGLGDAFSSFGVFLVTSVALVGIVAIFAPDSGLNSPWLPLLVAGPQVGQGLFVWWIARAKGTGTDRDFGMRFLKIDWLIGPVLLVLGFIAIAGVVAAMNAVGAETPTASVAELLEDAADEETDEPGAESGGLLEGEGDSGLTIWIIFVAVFASTAVPVIEELVYRGLWWSALLKRGMSEWWVLIITSAAFAAAHFEPARFPVLFVLGLALGMGRLLTGRIGAAIVTHALINGLGMIALVLTV
ncbi:MAG: CPBP family intramembrane glutamic endopeptidase, partial [Actinomycetota bacterium]